MGALDQPSAGSGVGSKPTVLFKASPTAILTGGSSELTWTVIEGASAYIDQGIGSVAQSGKKTVIPAATTKYTLVAKNNKGETKVEATVTVAAAAAAANWTGTWQCGQYKMYLTQTGSQVTGWYDNQNGDIEGYAAGGTIVGTWYDAQAGSRDIQLTMSANGNAFTGHYRTGASGSWVSYWSCTRISSAIPPAKPSALGPPPMAPAANWTGSWLCGQWGRLTLTQSGDQVTGSYTYENGKLTGYATGNTLVGTWSEAPTYNPPDDAGDVQFTLSTDGNSFSGHWRYGSSGDWKPWNGNKDH
jgi:hypothetical protein